MNDHLARLIACIYPLLTRRTIMKTAIILIALFLAACGGGDWTAEELRKDGAPPNCDVSPDSCG